MLKPPEIWPSVHTPAPEIDAFRDLYVNLWGVYYNVEGWESALRLFQFCMRKPLLVDAESARKWKFIAAHESVHQLHHFRERLALIKGHKVRACPSISAVIDTRALRAATRKLDQCFPHVDSLRHAVAHSGSNEVLPQEHASPDGWLMTKLENGGRFSTHYQGIERSLEITDESLELIRGVADMFLSGFAAAAALLKEQGYADED